jgi:hypothetical protein
MMIKRFSALPTLVTFAALRSEPLHFGIGNATVAAVQIIWPSGIIDVFPTVNADSTLTVVEGS